MNSFGGAVRLVIAYQSVLQASSYGKLGRYEYSRGKGEFQWLLDLSAHSDDVMI